MNKNHQLENIVLEKLFNSIIRCYAKGFSNELPTFSDFKALPTNSNNKWYRSVELRMTAINELRNARDLGLKINTNHIWTKISESIRIIPLEATVSSIGSQGFLSIPLFKYDDEMENFEFLRLHIWDTSLNQQVNTETRDNFSIHNHSFHSESWIICGQIINDRYIAEETEDVSKYSFFKIAYNNTLNEVNQHTSTAVKTDLFAKLDQISHEVYFKGGNYSIKAGDFHKSGSATNEEISATLFSFTADKNFNSSSVVIGPSNIQSSEINRKELIDPTDLIKKIDKTFK